MPLLLRKIILTGLCCIAIVAISSSQNSCGCDEAEQLRGPMGKYFNSGVLDSAAFYTQKLLTFREAGCKIFYNDWMAQIAVARKDYASARKLLLEENRLLKEGSCDNSLYVRFYNTTARLYQELNEFDSMVVAYINEIDVAEKGGDNYGLARASADLATAFSQAGQTEKAVSYFSKAINAARKQTKVPSLIATVQTRLASLYLERFKKSGDRRYADSAALVGKNALDTAGKYQDLLAFLEANSVLADHALLTNDPETAIKYAEQIIVRSPRSVHLFDRFLFNGFSAKSRAFYQLHAFGPAEVMADSALIYARAFNPQMMIGAYKDLYLAAKENGNMEKSLAAHEKMVAIDDSLFTVENNKNITELEKKYNQAKNENTIKDLAKKKQLYLLLAIAGLLAAAAIAFFLRQQSLTHKKNILEAEQRLNRARMNPHFFFNALTALQKFAIRENDGQTLASNLSRFSNIMRETLESTYKEYVTIEQEAEFLSEYLEVQKIRFPKTFTYEIVVADDLEVDELQIPSMIIQPFVENSIEHGFAGIDYPGNVTVRFRKENGELLVHIIDNGNGLATSPKQEGSHISRASQIIKDRIYLLNIKLKTKAGFSIANNREGRGVSVRIHLPLLYKNFEN